MSSQSTEAQLQQEQSRGLFSLYKVFTPRSLVAMCLLLLLKMLFSRIMVYPTEGFKLLDLSYVPGVIAAVLYGPWYAMVYSIPADFLGYLVMQSPDAYFVGYLFTALLSNLIYACLLYRQMEKPLLVLFARAALARLFVTVLLLFGLNSLWWSVTHGVPIGSYVTAERLLRNLWQFPIHTAIVFIFAWISPKFR